ncbi:lysophospholipid acyltransferase family protein [Phytomonospora sp. NPDC050363]|uniref:lysophospholipid acyltransferase family protein n=1 Tax=Phytomonospora sp. NPDC050363 TaxID=3155642 RepID=UPI0033DE8355
MSTRGWFPASDCTPSCLPEGAALPTVGPLRRAARTLALASVLSVAAVLLPFAPALGPRLARAAIRAVGVLVPLRPRPVAPGSLVVANHSSWLDVVALTALGGPGAPVRMIAKREVGDWPFVGRLARLTRAIFVDRGSLRALPATVGAIAGRLRAGESVGVFPEATTWCLPARGRFRRAPFQAAIDAEATVAPVTLWFTLADGTPTTAAAFLGEETFLSSLRRVVRTRGLRLHVIASEPFQAVGDRRGLASRAEAAVVHEALAGLVAGMRERAAATSEPFAPELLVPGWNRAQPTAVEAVGADVARRPRVLSPLP